jgi:hypothetical protein
MAVIGGILAILAMLVTFGLQKSHHEQTGVWGPTRSQMRYIRRKARKEGISEHAAYEAWLSNKQRSLGAGAAPTFVPLPTFKPTKRTGRIGWALAVFAALFALVVLSSPKRRLPALLWSMPLGSTVGPKPQRRRRLCGSCRETIRC